MSTAVEHLLLALGHRLDHHGIFGLRLRARTPVVVTALLLVAGILALPAAEPHDAGVILLFVMPIALCAISFGVLGGLTAGAVGVALTVTWQTLTGHSFDPIGSVIAATVLFVAGGVLGYFVEERRALTKVLDRHHEMSLDLIATADFDGYFKRLNPSWQRILGYSDEELRTHPYLEFVHPDDRDATIAEAKKLAEARGDAINFRNRYRCKDGSYRWLEWNSKADERLIYAVARDITERKRAEETLERHAELLEQAVRERTRELEEARIETLQRLAIAAEYRDDETYEHTERVGRAAALVAQRLRLPARDVTLIRQAAPLHDLGKLGISDSILLKPGKLTFEEFELIKSHATIGASILADSSSDVLRLAEEIALSHHEWWDGNGYPTGLRGEAIPLSGRIVAIADVFDALTHSRPYKDAWPVADAVAEIRRLSGRQFDPRSVDAFDQLEHAALLGPTRAPLASAA